MADDKAKILVVDDNPTSVGVLIGLLRDYDVRVALNGPTALRILERHPPDVILLDIDMPGMDGFELCRRVKAHPDLYDIPILFITGYTDEATIVRAFDIGASDYVAKPFRSRELLARVRIQVGYRRAMAALHAMAVTDALTGLPNRHAFFQRGARLFEEARTKGRALAAMMLDIDRFKQVNDRFGHAQGDEVLRRVAAEVLRHLSARDLAARIGGEELAVLVPSGEEATVVALAERMRRGIARQQLDTPGGPLRVTASIGVAALEPGLDSLDALVARADDRLYQAKRAGRDRVVPAPEPAGAPARVQVPSGPAATAGDAGAAGREAAAAPVAAPGVAGAETGRGSPRRTSEDHGA